MKMKKCILLLCIVLVMTLFCGCVENKTSSKSNDDTKTSIETSNLVPSIETADTSDNSVAAESQQPVDSENVSPDPSEQEDNVDQTDSEYTGDMEVSEYETEIDQGLGVGGF